MFIFWLCSTSDDRSSNPSKKHQPKCTRKTQKGPLSHQKIKCSFLDYIQLLMIGRVIRAKNINRNTKKWKRPPSHRKVKCSFLDYIQLLMIGRAGQSSKNKMFVNDYDLNPDLPPLSSQKNEMLIFGLCSTSDDLPGWSMDSNPICHPSSAKKMKCSFLDYVQLLMIGWAIREKNIDQNAKNPKKAP